MHLEETKLPSLRKVVRSGVNPPAPFGFSQEPVSWFCSGWFAPESACRNAAPIAIAETARMDSNFVLLRPVCLADRFTRFIIRLLFSGLWLFLSALRHFV